MSQEGHILLAVVGTFLPVMPTVPFLILAAYCFERGSPEAFAWLMQNERFARPIIDWRKNRVIRPKSKMLAVACLSGSITYSVGFSEFPMPARLSAGAISLVAMLWILLQRSNAQPNTQEKNHDNNQ